MSASEGASAAALREQPAPAVRLPSQGLRPPREAAGPAAGVAAEPQCAKSPAKGVQRSLRT
eukprot:CAMPEP_0195116926 /NCGR_PEP_ID=MMETSP0448-20130528/113168_1 /TAXON_ID=66468 /ORGANISM="Heterocapsa triquestra, Strain CCMP 448" /LENGTH=60 /DNA_ID=CAMNT_0040154121 /DNA_START=12 /DNA_END=191 /DNA_ORIENTATION=-